MKYDLVIVGLGPVGATAANLAGLWGLHTLALDRAYEPYALPRAICFDHEVMRVFQNIGIADEIADHVMPYRPTEYRGMDGRAIKRFISQPEPHALGWSPNFVFTQPPVEARLRRQIDHRSSVEVMLGSEALGIENSDQHVAMEYRHADGQIRRIESRYLLACDGGTSGVRRRLGLTMDSLDFDEPWLVVDAHVKPEHLSELPDCNIQFCEPERPATYVVGPGNHRRWEIMLKDGESPEDIAREENVCCLLSRWIDPSKLRIWRAAAYRFHALVSKQWRCGRVFLAGDAAHMTPPFLAQGMCQGVRDAANLIWKLSMVVKGVAGDALLDSYQRERAPHVRRTTEVAKQFGRIICERNPDRARERDARLRSEFRGEPPVTIRQELIPGLVDGLVDRRDPDSDVNSALPGRVFPQPRVLDAFGHEWRLDDLSGARFRLVVRAPVDLAAIRLEFDELFEQATMLSVLLTDPSADMRVHGIVSVSDPSGLLTSWMDAMRCNAVLVRPDHYVFGGATNTPETRELLLRLQDSMRAQSTTTSHQQASSSLHR